MKQDPYCRLTTVQELLADANHFLIPYHRHGALPLPFFSASSLRFCLERELAASLQPFDQPERAPLNSVASRLLVAWALVELMKVVTSKELAVGKA